jgi:hypothetical protein
MVSADCVENSSVSDKHNHKWGMGQACFVHLVPPGTLPDFQICLFIAFIPSFGVAIHRIAWLTWAIETLKIVGGSSTRTTLVVRLPGEEETAT